MYNNELIQETNRKFLCPIPIVHTNSSKYIHLNVDHHTGTKWFIHSPKHRKEMHLLSLNTSVDLALYNLQ